MKKKRVIASLLSALLVLSVSFLSGCNKKVLTIYDSQGEPIAEVRTLDIQKMKLKDEGLSSYVGIVIQEAANAIAEKETILVSEAKEKLLEEEFKVYTSFDPNAYKAIKKTYDSNKDEELQFGCAITDTKGHLIATYGADSDDTQYVNYAGIQTPAYSSFKPLSVYAPALEKGLISWSTTYEDSPVKQIEESDGTLRDWPKNATEKYTNQRITINEAIKKSLNTVAVRCLQEYGVKESIQYLTNAFGIDLSYEVNKMNLAGEEEILGNLALGYLENGVSPIDMAGYYQVFTNLGIYTEPKAVTKICDNKGNILYKTEVEEKRVINMETAYVMNLLLQGVVARGGTGEKAQIKGVQVGGKTGTGEKGNWFVGFTPEYTCAVWHGKYQNSNCTAEMFSKIVSDLKHTVDKNYPECKFVEMKPYCLESGMLFSVTGGCKQAGTGYYTSLNKTKRCEIHK